MAMFSVSSLSFCFLLLFLVSDCMAVRHRRRMEQRPQLEECQFDRLEALVPDYRVESEGGVTESWNHNNKLLRCAGVAIIRRTLYPKALILPSYTNAPQVMYIVQGDGLQGMTIFPSCPESFEEAEESGQKFREQHQKVHELRGGDIIAIPAGIGYWYYNNGNIPLITVILLDTSSISNQLDRNPRRFYLGGNPEDEHGEVEGNRGSGRNVFSGIAEELLTELYGVGVETVRKMQGANDTRKNMVIVEEGLDIVRPEPGQRVRKPRRQQEHGREKGQGGNGLEETICTLRVREALGGPARADIYTPHAGRISTLNSIKLPILADLRLSCERGVLYKNGVYVPHWNLNANSIVYVTGGRGRVQVVDDKGNSVFDKEMEEGQVLVIPQSFVVVKQAGEEGFEWIAFKTAENAMINTLTGRASATRVMPVDVVAKMYRVSREEAQRIKEARDQSFLFTLDPKPQTRATAWY